MLSNIDGGDCDDVDYCKCANWDKNENLDYTGNGSWENDYVSDMLVI